MSYNQRMNHDQNPAVVLVVVLFLVVVLLLGQCLQGFILDMHDLPALGHLP